MSISNRTNAFLLQDGLIIAISIGAAVLLVKTDAITSVLALTKEGGFLGSFVAGLFFTSVFTAAPAIVTLGEMATINSVMSVAFFGAMGAVIGDLVIFRFVRDRFSNHILEVMRQQHLWKRVRMLLAPRLFRWVSFFVGGLIIASPFPDELGVSLFGFSKIKTSWFIPLSFFFNFVGIVLIGLVARAV